MADVDPILARRLQLIDRAKRILADPKLPPHLRPNAERVLYGLQIMVGEKPRPKPDGALLETHREHEPATDTDLGPEDRPPASRVLSGNDPMLSLCQRTDRKGQVEGSLPAGRTPSGGLLKSQFDGPGALNKGTGASAAQPGESRARRSGPALLYRKWVVVAAVGLSIALILGNPELQKSPPEAHLGAFIYGPLIAAGLALLGFHIIDLLTQVETRRDAIARVRTAPIVTALDVLQIALVAVFFARLFLVSIGFDLSFSTPFVVIPICWIVVLFLKGLVRRQ